MKIIIIIIIIRDIVCPRNMSVNTLHKGDDDDNNNNNKGNICRQKSLNL